MQEIDFDRSLKKCLPGLSGQTYIGGSFADPEQIRMANIKTCSIGQNDAERLKRLFARGWNGVPRETYKRLLFSNSASVVSVLADRTENQIFLGEGSV